MKLKEWHNIYRVIVKANSIVQHEIQNKKGIIKHQCECKSYCCKCKKDYSWNSSSFCENSKYFKSVADTSVTKCDEMLIVTDNLSTKKTNIATNAMSTASISFHSKHVRDCCILHAVLLVIILLLIITIICYCYAEQKVWYKMENNEF